MAPWKRADKSDYLNQNLRAHDILKDVPIHDIWQVDLPGGGKGRTVSDIHSLFLSIPPNRFVNFLFAVRWFLGKMFGWDREPESNEELFQHRITEKDCTLSSVTAGTKDGPFTVLYVHPTEAMSEIRNATVHAALVWVLIPRDEGYRMLWAIYVKPVGRLTAFYMWLIHPFRIWIVYPSILRRLYRAWCLKYKPNAAVSKE